ncbi:hypothetical protein IWQ56_005437, partial [Coemansia nantahalensis]
RRVVWHRPAVGHRRRRRPPGHRGGRAGGLAGQRPRARRRQRRQEARRVWPQQVCPPAREPDRGRAPGVLQPAHKRRRRRADHPGHPRGCAGGRHRRGRGRRGASNGRPVVCPRVGARRRARRARRRAQAHDRRHGGRLEDPPRPAQHHGARPPLPARGQVQGALPRIQAAV